MGVDIYNHGAFDVEETHALLYFEIVAELLTFFLWQHEDEHADDWDEAIVDADDLQTPISFSDGEMRLTVDIIPEFDMEAPKLITIAPVDPVDLTDFDVVKAEFSMPPPGDGSYTCYVDFYIHADREGESPGEVSDYISYPSGGGDGSFELDISGLSGEYYVVAGIDVPSADPDDGWDGFMFRAAFDEIWLE